jgi:propionyl-CoA carboxylase alpha chain
MMNQVINKILIANRGEIACRVIRTARQRGIATVAVYSDADRHALHVQQADEAVHIGGNASSESYLRIDGIVDAAKKTGADAVHPGYGFLSENPTFATALAKAGIIFIGPGVRAIEAMGDKIESKKLAEAAGVNTIPGHNEAVADADAAHNIALSIGCPVMLKASAGGGGKGMRVAFSIDQVRDGFTSAQNEARSAFGDDRVFIEKFVEKPRHIEIQIIADQHGQCVYLGERECSIQRRHQKVIEEAPSPFINDATRKAMGEQAVALAAAVDYVSAGTVEFIVDTQGQFYFLEMNTRLQVEHPVTECITGLDLVSLMIDVAAGKPLPLTQEDVVIDGWAFEARVYAEDPDRGFLPSTGRITHYVPPTAGMPEPAGSGDIGNAAMRFADQCNEASSSDSNREISRDSGGDFIRASSRDYIRNYIRASSRDDIPDSSRDFIRDSSGNFIRDSIRVDTGVQAGGEISIYYDPMIAKLITWAPNRDAALAQMQIALDSYRIEGVRHNLPFLSALFAHPSFQAGDLTTQFIDDHFPNGFDSRAYVAKEAQYLPYIAAWLEHTCRQRDHVSVCSEFRPLCVLENELQHDITAAQLAGVDSQWLPGDWSFNGKVDGQELLVTVKRDGNSWQLGCRGSVREFRVMDPHVVELLALMPVKQSLDLSKLLLSPMPGLLMKVLVNTGDNVTAGQDLAVIEAMKMENTLRAEISGTVKTVNAAVGDSLAVDAVILEFE